MEEQNENYKKGFLIALVSIAIVCIVIFIGIILFFPNKNLASDISEKNISLEKVNSNTEDIQNEENNNDKLEISEDNNEIVIDLTKDLKKNRNISEQPESKDIISKSETVDIDENKAPNKQTEKPKMNSNTAKNDLNTNKAPVTKPLNTNIIEKKPTKPLKVEKPKNEVKPIKEINPDDKYNPNKEYYIQFVSLSDAIKADDKITILSKYNLKAKIYSATVNDKEIYRVRSGPYRTVSEAKADLSKISGINEFNDAYILSISK